MVWQDVLEPEAVLAGPLLVLQFPDFFHPAFQDVPSCTFQHFMAVFFKSRHRKFPAFICFPLGLVLFGVYIYHSEGT